MNFQLIGNFSLASTIVFSLVAGVPNQSADARGGGCSTFDSKGSPGVGNTCIWVEGRGLVVSSVKGYFVKANKLCDWHYVISYQDRNNSPYVTFTQPVQKGCAGQGQYLYSHNPPYRAQRGRVCALLYAKGYYIDAACADIYPE